MILFFYSSENAAIIVGVIGIILTVLIVILLVILVFFIRKRLKVNQTVHQGIIIIMHTTAD